MTSPCAPVKTQNYPSSKFRHSDPEGLAVAELLGGKILSRDQNTGPCHQTRRLSPSESACNPIEFNSTPASKNFMTPGLWLSVLVL